MFRHPTLLFGLLALALVFAAPARPVVGQEPAPGHGTTPAPHMNTPAENQEARFTKAAARSEIGGETAALQHGESPNIMAVQSPLAIYSVVVFVLTLLILTRFAWKPLIQALHEREAHLEQVLHDSERARNEAEAMAARHRKQLDAAADEVRALIDQARKEGQAAADAIVRKAQAEAEASRDRAEREISGARDQALMEIWSKTADLAVSVAGRVLARDLGEADHRRLVEVALSELPTDGRQGGRA